MEPKKSSLQHQPRTMEPKKSSHLGARAASNNNNAEPSLSNLFYPPEPKVNGKDQDLYNILYKGQSSGKQTDGKAQWNPSKSHSTHTKDSKQSPDDTSCFGSSVHYGGRDYYGGSTTKQGVESSSDYKATKKDPATDSHGDWWQGSFYY